MAYIQFRLVCQWHKAPQAGFGCFAVSAKMVPIFFLFLYVLIFHYNQSDSIPILLSRELAMVFEKVIKIKPHYDSFIAFEN